MTNTIAEVAEQALDRMSAHMDAKFADFERRLEDKAAKASRPAFDSIDADTKNSPELKSFRDYLRTGRPPDQKAMAASTNDGADGGYAVPKVIDSMIESLVVNISPIRRIANVVQIGTSDFHKLVNQRGTASGWVAETAARPATTTPTFADIKIAPFELYANPQITQTLLDDAFFDASSWLAGELATEFARAEGAAFVNGNGTTQPLGFLAGPTPLATADGLRAFGTLGYVPTGTAGAFASSNPADVLLATVYSIKSQFRANATWVMNKSTLAVISQFKDTAGRYVLEPMSSPSMPAMLLGFPIVEAEDMPVIAANSFSIAFGDFARGYTVTDRFGTRILHDPFSNKPFVGFYGVRRTGGAIVNSEAIRLIKFSAT